MLGGNMILTQIKAYGWMALSIIFGSLLATQTVRLHSAQLAEAKAITTLSDERAIAAAALVTSQSSIRTTENTLNTSASETRKNTNEQVTALTSQRDALLKRVRYAEANAATAALVSKATSVTCNGQASSTDHGGELLRTIGEEDVDEANRADIIRTHLKACYRQYDEARQALSR